VNRKFLAKSSNFTHSRFDFHIILKVIRAVVAKESSFSQVGWYTTATSFISSVNELRLTINPPTSEAPERPSRALQGRWADDMNSAGLFRVAFAVSLFEKSFYSIVAAESSFSILRPAPPPNFRCRKTSSQVWRSDALTGRKIPAFVYNEIDESYIMVFDATLVEHSIPVRTCPATGYSPPLSWPLLTQSRS
jgi:hypothetical protein